MYLSTIILAQDALPPVPVSTSWVPALVLVLVWILVAAAVVGPIVRFFRAEPRATQGFSDDPPGMLPRR